VDGDGDADQESAEADGPSAPPMILRYHASNEEAPAALDRLEALVEDLRREERSRRFRDAGGEGDLAARVALEEVDVATEEEAGGAEAGRLVPYLLLFTLFMGASPLAIDMVAGEKERGTLETLYLAPVERHKIARAKFLVVAGGTMVTGVLNLSSLVLCYRLGLIGGAAEGLALSTRGIAVSLVLVLPLAAMVGGLLLGISAFARSQKEGQYYVMPVILLAFVPAVLSMTQDVKLDGFLALIPLANVSVALRDALLGVLPVGKLMLVTAASVFWAAVVVRWTAGVLSREDTILGFDPEPAFGHTVAGRRRAAYLGLAVTTLAYFYLGQMLQNWNLIGGLIASLWLLLPFLGGASLRFAWAGGTLKSLLSWRAPRPAALLGAVLCGVGMVLPVVEGLFALQTRFLPMPEDMAAAFESLEALSLPVILLLVAATPGICEELVFRGVFLGLLRRTGTVGAAVLVSSAFFALIHLNVFRFLPTFALGLVMAGIVVRTRSIFPSMLFHAVYNGVTITMSEWSEPWRPEGPVGWGVSLLLLGAGAALLRFDAARSSAEPDDPLGEGLSAPLQAHEVDSRTGR
jgi:sodium transport system permease protein